MRIAYPLCVLLLLTLLVGCGGRSVYLHPERTSQQEENDYYDCSFEAQKATGNLQSSSDREKRIEEMIDSCMFSRGYRK